VRLPTVAEYVVMEGEVEPACKQAAVDYLQTALSADPGDKGEASVADLAARLEARGMDARPAATLQAMLPRGEASALEVVYPQYGGLTAALTDASVMLVANQYRVAVGRRDVEALSSTFDVRLQRQAKAWAVTEVIPASSPAAVAGTPSPAAVSVLAHPRILLPGAARADLLSGAIDDRVSEALLALAQRWKLHVQVIRSGHPINVFATDRVSNHTRGRAVDIWSIDDVPVIDHSTSAWKSVMQAALQVSGEVGGPQRIGAGSFTDHVHQDHVHVGFD